MDVEAAALRAARVRGADREGRCEETKDAFDARATRRQADKGTGSERGEIHERAVTSDDRRNRCQSRINLSSSVNGMAHIRDDSVYYLKFGCLIVYCCDFQLVELGAANSTFFSCSVGHSFLQISLFTNVKAFMNSIDM